MANFILRRALYHIFCPQKFVQSNQIFCWTGCITPMRVTCLGGPNLRHCVSRQHSSFRRNVAAVSSHWHHCVRFDRLKIWASDLSIQRRTRYRWTNWPVEKFVDHKKVFHRSGFSRIFRSNGSHFSSATFSVSSRVGWKPPKMFSRPGVAILPRTQCHLLSGKPVSAGKHYWWKKKTTTTWRLL